VIKMFIDLQRGILEEFEEAQHKSYRNKKHVHAELSGANGFCIVDSDKKAEQLLAWIAAHPQKWLLNTQSWKARNPEKVKAQKARWYQRRKARKNGLEERSAQNVNT